MSNTTTTAAPCEFDYINLNDVDTTFQPVETNVYTLELNKLTPTIVTPQKGNFAGQQVLVLKGSYTIVDDEKNSGRKLFNDFWMNREINKKLLRKQADAIGVHQVEGQTLSDYAAQFETLSPSARFQVQVVKRPDFNDPNTPVNEIKFFTAKPV